jgi:hypothetical protein
MPDDQSEKQSFTGNRHSVSDNPLLCLNGHTVGPYVFAA